MYAPSLDVITVRVWVEPDTAQGRPQWILYPGAAPADTIPRGSPSGCYPGVGPSWYYPGAAPVDTGTHWGCRGSTQQLNITYITQGWHQRTHFIGGPNRITAFYLLLQPTLYAPPPPPWWKFDLDPIIAPLKRDFKGGLNAVTMVYRSQWVRGYFVKRPRVPIVQAVSKQTCTE